MREGQKRDTARKLRHNATDAERMIWRLLRDRRLQGIKFRRQVPIGPFVADFASIEHRLIVELDGSQHAESSSDAPRWLPYFRGLACAAVLEQRCDTESQWSA